MEFMTAREAAQRWKISERYVQMYCTNGRIEGAKKLGGAWMIPANAPRPLDMRRNDAKAEKARTQKVDVGKLAFMPLPLMNTPFASGCMREAVEAMQNEDERNIAWAEFSYYTGHAKEAVRMAKPYLESAYLELKMSAFFIYGSANLSLGNIEETRRIVGRAFEIFRSMDENTPRIHQGLVVFVCGAFDTLLHLPRSRELPDMQTFIPMFPLGLQLFAAYVQARYGYLNGLHGTAIGIAETALVLVEGINPISGVFIRLMCAMSYMHTQYPQMAKRHLAAAWAAAKADDLIQPFGEFHSELWGMLEAVLKTEEPEAFRRMIRIAKSYGAGWAELHNAMTGHQVPTNLTPTEFTIARLAAMDWTNAQISTHLGISESRVKKCITLTLQTLHIEQRIELKNYMLY